MSEAIRCDYCKEDIEGQPVTRLGKSYCSEGCAFEAYGRPKSKQCGVPTAQPLEESKTSSAEL